MFVDFKDQPPPPPWQPRPAKRGPQLTPRQQRTLGAILGVNILLLLVAPIGGATLLELLGIVLR
ncbi:hypothetical protein GGQ80_002452 [Sphingomonas jinjuensis]|uniref:Uncharacterized protein n=1 Tax=Sphingomonas jinjuensis TaxID=535907 RepID=A0A840FE96_9SPHN|nr:hypothetical protein [Sphingomonas jinjuensis]MBB4154536.1 hypothetical protein [Sphingomonas jinjuensis]